MWRSISIFMAWLVAAGGTTFAADAAASTAVDALLPTWLSTLLGSAPSAGILIWYIYYTTAVRWPQIEERFAKERKETEDRFAAERLESERRHFDHLTTRDQNHRGDMEGLWKVKREDEREESLKRHQVDERMLTAIAALTEEMRKMRCRYEPARGEHGP